MKTTTYTKEQMRLINGNIYIVSPTDEAGFEIDGTVYIATTDKTVDFNTMPREYFVEPVAVEAMAHAHALDTFVWPKNNNGEPISLPPGQTTPPGFKKHCKAVEKHFTAGYNANKAEFTREEMIAAMKYAAARIVISTDRKEFDDDLLKYFDSLRPLSLPASITIDENWNVLTVKW
jgi:hypothetical protein